MPFTAEGNTGGVVYRESAEFKALHAIESRDVSRAQLYAHLELQDRWRHRLRRWTPKPCREGDPEDFYPRSHNGKGFREEVGEAHFSPPPSSLSGASRACLGPRVPVAGITYWDRGLLSLLTNNSLLQASFESRRGAPTLPQHRQKP